MTSEEFQAVYPLVIGWIRETLAANAENAQSVGSKRFARLPLYFGNEFLEATKVVAVDRVPVPPLSSFGLSRFAHFERVDYDGIAYLNMFFVKQTLAGDEGLHFHALIHVVQWALLGPERFVTMYADGLETFGYRHSPLENAYWYFRLNGFLQIENFVVHPERRGSQRTDADLLAVRFPHRAERLFDYPPWPTSRRSNCRSGCSWGGSGRLPLAGAVGFPGPAQDRR